jgi:hypothetical protein
MRREEIGYAVRRFTDGDEQPVFWGYFPAYDWVAFSWLFGSMDELPFHYPQLWGRPLLGRGGLKVVEKFRKFSMPSGVGISMACLMS